MNSIGGILAAARRRCKQVGSPLERLSRQRRAVLLSYAQSIAVMPKRKPNGSKHSSRFLKSKEWLALRLKALERYGQKCMKCGSGKQIQVDHIKPKSKYPHLALEISNLQILCWPCNKAKASRSETDYR